MGILAGDGVDAGRGIGGCEMKMDIGDIGAENTNFRQFRSRVERSLDKQESAKAKEPPRAPGTSKSTLPVHQ